MSKAVPTPELPQADSFEERIEVLVDELELAVKWNRPSILFAIYRSELVRAEAEAGLQRRLDGRGLQVTRVHAGQEADFDLPAKIDGLTGLDRSVLFIDGFQWDCGPQGARVYREVNQNREYFIDNNLRALFWLHEGEVPNFANNATECWILRHQVVEFTDAPRPVQTLLQAIDTIWEGLDEDLEPQGQVPVRPLLELLENGLPEGAEANPVHASILLTLGILYWRKGDCETALRFLEAAGEIADLLDDPQLAAQCREAIDLASGEVGDCPTPVVPVPWGQLGRLLARQERNEEALLSYKRAVEEDPADARSWEGLGLTFLKLGLPQNAVSAFQHGLEVDPGLGAAWTGLGRGQAASGQEDLALEAFRKAADLDDQDSEAWLGLARILAARGNDGEALEACRKAVAGDPQNAPAWREMGNLHLKAGDFEAGASAFEKVVVLRPNCGWGLSSLAYACARLGNLERAAGLFEQSIPLFENPKDQAALWLHLAEVRSKQKDERRAREARRQAEALQGAAPAGSLPVSVVPPPEPSIATVPALRRRSVPSRPAPAGESLPTMTDLLPDLDLRAAPEWNALGNHLLKSGSFNDAIAAYTKAIETAPELNWPYISNLANAYYYKGKLKGRKAAGKPEDPELWDTDEDEAEACASPEEDLPMPERNDSQAAAGQEQTAEAIESLDETRLSDLLSSLPEELSGHWLAGPEPQACACEAPSALPESLELPPQAELVDQPQSFESPLDGLDADPDPGNSIDWNELGNAYVRNGEYERAIEAYKKAIAMNPHFGLPYSNLGFVYFHQGEYPIAIALYKKSIDLLDGSEEKAATWNRLGDAYRRMREYGSALKAYENAGKNDPATSPLMARARVALMGNSPR